MEVEVWMCPILTQRSPKRCKHLFPLCLCSADGLHTVARGMSLWKHQAGEVSASAAGGRQFQDQGTKALQWLLPVFVEVLLSLICRNYGQNALVGEKHLHHFLKQTEGLRTLMGPFQGTPPTLQAVANVAPVGWEEPHWFLLQRPHWLAASKGVPTSEAHLPAVCVWLHQGAWHQAPPMLRPSQFP